MYLHTLKKDLPVAVEGWTVALDNENLLDFISYRKRRKIVVLLLVGFREDVRREEQTKVSTPLRNPPEDL